MPVSPLIVVAEDAELPDDTEQKEECLQELQSAVTEILAEYGAAPDRLHTIDGPIYTQIDPICPDCGDMLSLPQPESISWNGACSFPKCTCGFEGRAVYRLIDIEQNIDTGTAEEMFSPESAVGDETIRFNLSFYEGTERHLNSLD